jgi:endonuclease-3 related protein
LLYAGNHAVFVVDAYTRRIFERHALISSKADYEDIRSLVESVLTQASGPIALDGAGSDPRHPVSKMSGMARGELVQHYNELHALIVRAGNQYCRKMAKCDECPLREFLPGSVERTVEDELRSRRHR